MVLDPMTSLALAGAAVQFVDFASKLVSKTYKYYRSAQGSVTENRERQVVAITLSRLTKEINRSLILTDGAGRLSETEIALQKVSRECLETAKDLRTALTALESVRGSCASFIQSFRLALADIWGKKKIDQMEHRLDEARKQLMIHLMVLSSERQMEGFSQVRDDQKNLLEQILEATSKTQNDLRRQIAVLSENLAKASAAQKEAVVLARWQVHNKNDIDLVLQRLAKDKEELNRKENEQKYLDSLFFVRMKERRRRIPKAHENTFRWIYEQAPTNTPGQASGIHSDEISWDSVSDWLCSTAHEDSVYWITGKPGSGKSTLMRFILDTQKTRDLLQAWAGDRKIVLTECFFWNAGTDLQKSQGGLLRSLLYDLLHACPHLIPAVSPWRWRSYDFGADSLEPWTDAELHIALQDCLAAATADGYSVCLFIDGLDEFEGPEEQLIEIVSLVKLLSSNDHVKLCVSSRPWLVFEDAFQNDKRLRVQDLTFGDICQYVEDLFEANEHFQRFKQRNPTACSQLKGEVARKSQGVFLWVFLVVRSLLQGFRNRDHVSILLKRLEQMPSELDAFFEQMLNQIQVLYRPITAAIFQVALETSNELSLMHLSFVDIEGSDFGISSTIQPVTEETVQSQLEDTAIRLKASCKDFLEIYSKSGHGWLTTYYVEFLHRTLRDFLCTPEVQVTLSGYAEGKRMDVDVYLSNALLAEIKMLSLRPDYTVHTSAIDEFIELSESLTTQLSTDLDRLLPDVQREFNNIMRNHYKTYASVRIDASRHPWMREYLGDKAILGCATHWKISEFLQWVGNGQIPRMENSMLRYAAQRLVRHPATMSSINLNKSFRRA